MQKIGIAGIGNISKIYMDNLTGIFSKRVKLTAVADVIADRAKKAADDYHIKAYSSCEELVNNPDVDMVLNLTQPRYHHEIAMAAVKAGKHA
jgi:predicted dehydrogenase